MKILILAILFCSSFIFPSSSFASHIELKPCVEIAHCVREEWEFKDIEEPFEKIKTFWILVNQLFFDSLPNHLLQLLILILLIRCLIQVKRILLSRLHTSSIYWLPLHEDNRHQFLQSQFLECFR